MNRREVGSLLAFWGVVATAGCLSSRAPTDAATTTNAPTESPGSTTEVPTQAVSVTKRVEAGQTGLIRVVHVHDGGAVSLELTCPDGTTTSARGQLSAQEWRRLEQRILDMDLTAFQSTYQCESDCPSDIPSRQVTISAGEHVTETRIEAGGTPPEPLAALLSRLTEISDGIDTPRCPRDQ